MREMMPSKVVVIARDAPLTECREDLVVRDLVQRPVLQEQVLSARLVSLIVIKARVVLAMGSAVVLHGSPNDALVALGDASPFALVQSFGSCNLVSVNISAKQEQLGLPRLRDDEMAGAIPVVARRAAGQEGGDLEGL